MSTGSIRKGVTQAQFNEEASDFLYSEIFIIAIALGLYFQSWYVGGGTMVGLIIAFHIKTLNLFIAFLFSICWSVIAAAIVHLLLEGNSDSLFALIWYEVILICFSTPGSQVVGGIVFLSSLGWHLGAIEWQRDLTDGQDRNI